MVYWHQSCLSLSWKHSRLFHLLPQLSKQGAKRQADQRKIPTTGLMGVLGVSTKITLRTWVVRSQSQGRVRHALPPPLKYFLLLPILESRSSSGSDLSRTEEKTTNSWNRPGRKLCFCQGRRRARLFCFWGEGGRRKCKRATASPQPHKAGSSGA